MLLDQAICISCLFESRFLFLLFSQGRRPRDPGQRIRLRGPSGHPRTKGWHPWIRHSATPLTDLALRGFCSLRKAHMGPDEDVLLLVWAIKSGNPVTCPEEFVCPEIARVDVMVFRWRGERRRQGPLRN